jgi:hypothetical protein
MSQGRETDLQPHHLARRPSINNNKNCYSATLPQRQSQGKGILSNLGTRGSSAANQSMMQEVNKKLQEVLEDTLLKNIELTGTIDALSQQLAQ